MQDRLGDLREIALIKNPNAAEKMVAGPSAAATYAQRAAEKMVAGPSAAERGHFDVQAQMGIAVDVKDEEGAGFMKEYQSNITVIKQGINDVNNAVSMFKVLRQKALQATSPDEEKEIARRVTALMDTANHKTMLIKNALQRLKEENVDFANKNSGSSEVKIRDNLHAALTRKFREILVEYQTLQTDYKQDVKGKVTRQVKIVYPEASDDELQALVDGGDAAQAIRSSIMGGHESLKNAVSDIQDKYRDIQRLERSVADLYQMFVDLATLVDAQGEMLDQIQYSVNSAKDYTEKADKELVEAKKYQASAQRRMCWISACLIVLALCIIVPLVIVLLK